MYRSILFLFCLAGHALAGPLDPLFSKPELWSLSQEAFSKLPEAKQFVWTSNLKDSARAAAHDMTLYGLPISESVARFENGKVSQITVAFYARGDAGEISREGFEQLLQRTVETLNTTTNVKAVTRGKEATNAVHAEGLLWHTPVAQYLLEYSFTREMKTRDIPFRAEFVRLTMSPPQRTVSLLASASNTSQAKFNGLTHVKRDLKTGDVLIPDLPMVDQGEKRYCAVACAERVMRYYGLSVDEHELAQAANTGTSGGTSGDAMFTALKKLGARLRLRVRPVEQMEIKQLLSLQTEYNRSARKVGAALLPDPGNVIDVNGMFDSMKPDLLLEARTKNRAELTRFEHAVQAHIDMGVPLVWSVVVGIFPEAAIPQGGGGHMRLIIGYNAGKQQILYSDSWGAGHELKRMPLAQAVSMTIGLTCIEPM